MKALKYFLGILSIIALIWSCSKEKFGDIDFVNSIKEPSNISALFNVTQDNTGTVTITPNAEGAVSFEVYYGDGTSSYATLKPGEYVVHVYPEGNFDVKVVAINLVGVKTEATIPLVVSFNPPENLVVTIENDPAVSKKVNVTATADWATFYEVYFGEPGNDTPVSANNGDTASYIYAEPGIYTIRVVSKSAAIQTTEYSVDFEVTAIMQPISSAPTPPARNPMDVISLYGTKYTNLEGTNFNPDWGQSGQGSSFAEFDLNGDKMLQYINLSYQGIALADGTTVDVSGMEYLHLDVWTTDVTALEVSLIQPGPVEKPVTVTLTPDEWNSIDIPIADYLNQGLTLTNLFQLKLVGTPWAAGTVFVDNLYFWKEPAPASGLEGIWVMAPEAGSLKVGPAPNDGSWWSNDAQSLIDRACYFDDQYVFNQDGTFKNVLGTSTWLESWQGVSPDQCGTPVAPHDGSTPATFLYDDVAGTLKLNGTGAYLGLPKANNTGELPNVPVPSSITYNITLLDNNNTMILTIETGASSGVYWTFKLVRYVSPLVGSWKLAPEAGALKVGPTYGSGDWWSSDAQTVIDRACYFDDEYVFDSTGVFKNVQGGSTWLETWQGISADGCGTPVAPHDGSNSASYYYDEANGKITLNGTGAYLGLPKANNAGELPNVAVPDSIIYDVTFIDNNTISVTIQAGLGVFWTYKLIR